VAVRAEWPSEDTPRAPRSYPQTVTIAAQLDAPDHRGWRNAQPLRLDAATRAAILKLVRQLTEAMRNRRLDEVIGLLQYKVNERARAYGWVGAQKLADLRADYRDFMQNPNWGMQDWQDQEAQMTLIAQNRMVRVTNPEGLPLIRSTDLGGFRLVVPADVTYVNGRWTILR
jgi:hypothetical protein